MKLAGIYAIILLLILAGCTDPTSIGGEFFEGDQSGLLAVDTITIRTATRTQSELIVHSPTAQFNTNLIGNFNDLVFGPVRADFYGQFQVNTNALPLFPNSAVFDSLVLILEYNVEGIYGDPTAEHEFEIYRITNDPVDSDSTFVSGDVLPIEDTPLTTIRFTPNLTEEVDSSIIIDIDLTTSPPDTTFATVNPSLRVMLPADLISNDMGTGLADINSDGNDQTNEDFLANFGGLAILPVEAPTGSMLSFNILGAIRTGLQLHYRTEDDGVIDTTLYEYNITTLSVRFSSFTNDLDADIVAAEEAGFAGGELETYIQGMDGPSTVVQLPFITDFEGEVLVNNAELTLTIQEAPDAGVDLFPPVTQIIILYKDEDGNFITIEDFLFAANGVGLDVFGGQPESFTGPNGEALTRYQMRISGHLQRMIEGDLPNEIYLRVFQKNERANRVVLFGAEHPDFPVTLEANFTNLN